VCIALFATVEIPLEQWVVHSKEVSDFIAARGIGKSNRLGPSSAVDQLDLLVLLGSKAVLFRGSDAT
jgi:hypothetical protein